MPNNCLRHHPARRLCIHSGQTPFIQVRRTAEEGSWDHLIEIYRYLGSPSTM